MMRPPRLIMTNPSGGPNLLLGASLTFRFPQLWASVDGSSNGRADGRMDGWMGRWIDGWMDGWMESAKMRYLDLVFPFW